ncbi:MAG TPA: c-type cytochrome [Spirochaetia bacterium]|nr:c-type cytochrome [Spirochaetia bacterium]
MIDSLYQFLARIGFPDPLHAPITHVPIGLVIGAFCFFYFAVIFGRSSMYLTARHVSILAFLFVFPTILFGVLDWIHFFKGALILPIKMKMILASAVMLLLGTGIILGAEVKVRSAPMMVIYALAVIAVVGLGWYGARLVYGGFSAQAAEAPATQQPAAAAAPAGAAAGAPAAPSPVRLGQRLFSANCATCHPAGGNLIEASLPLKTSKRLASQDAFIAFIRSPAMPNGSAGAMPAFAEGQISAKEARDLYAYVQSMIPAWK